MNGLRIVLNASSDGTISMSNNVANANGSDGISVDTTVGFNLTLTGRSNVTRNNGGDGVDLAIDSNSGSYDFGTLTDYGNNSMTGNGDVGIRWDNAGDGNPLSAEYNYWGGATNYAGSVTATQWLLSDPNAP